MKNRLLSLDVLRGLTIAGMIIVNNGVGGEPFIPLEHAEWNGLTPCDLVFPFFLFMVGVSIAFALGKFSPMAEEPQPKGAAIKKILVRTLKMFVIGLLLNASGPLIKGTPVMETLENLRIWGILQRIAVCYCIASFIILYLKPKHLWKIIFALLIIYGGILIGCNGYAHDESNIAAIIDQAIFGKAHLYTKDAIDPEGLLGLIACVAHTLIGVIVGFIIKDKEPLDKRLVRLFTLAVFMAIGGYLLHFGLPLNKRVWSPSYVFVTCGLAASLLGAFTVLIDIRGKKAWSTPFQWFGTNAIVLFVASGLMARIVGIWKLPSKLYDVLVGWGLTPQWASLGYSLVFLGVMTLLAYAMYKKKVFIKL